MNAEDYRLAALGDADAQVRVADYYDGPRHEPSVSPTGRPLRVLWGNAGNSMLSPPVPLLMIAKSRASDFRKVPLKYPLLGGTLWQNLMTQAFIN